jgi:hypothetical protein
VLPLCCLRLLLLALCELPIVEVVSCGLVLLLLLAVMAGSASMVVVMVVVLLVLLLFPGLLGWSL